MKTNTADGRTEELNGDTYVTQSEDNVLSSCLISGQVIDDGVELEVCEVGVGASSESYVDKTGDGETYAGGCSLTYGGLYLISISTP